MNIRLPASIRSFLLPAAFAAALLCPASIASAQPWPNASAAFAATAPDAVFDRLKDILTYGDLNGYNRPTKADAVVALGLLGDQRAVPLLIEHLAHEQQNHLRMLIAKSLGWLGNADAVPALETALNDVYPHTRKQAALALKAITGRDYTYDTTGLSDPKALEQALRARNTK